MRNTTSFYNTKNLYGWSEGKATINGMEKARNKRTVVISRSTFASSGRYTGHWLGDNSAGWSDLQVAIIGVQEFNIFGIPYVGSDICGFNGITNEELCLRWQQLGAFHSFSRNHNSIGNPPQDPAQWDSVAAAARKANLFRYRHLPYLYSLHFKASISGGTVVRPVFFEFPGDPTTVTLSHQFLWGEALMIIPVIQAGVEQVYGYLPPSATWYSLYDNYYGNEATPGNVSRSALKTSLIPVYIRGGYILPRQSPGLTTVYSRNNRMELVVALTKEGTPSAQGELYWDDGESLFTDISNHNYHQFTFFATVTSTTSTIQINKVRSATGITMTKLENIEIFGYNHYPNLTAITVNGKPITIDDPRGSYSPLTQILNITGSGLIDLNDGTSWTLSWPNIRIDDLRAEL